MAFYGQADLSKLRGDGVYIVRYRSANGRMVPTALRRHSGEWIYASHTICHEETYLETRDKRLLPAIKPTAIQDPPVSSQRKSRKKRVVVLTGGSRGVMSTVAALFTAFYSSVAAYLAYFGRTSRTEETPEDRVEMIRIDVDENAYEASEM